MAKEKEFLFTSLFLDTDQLFAGPKSIRSFRDNGPLSPVPISLGSTAACLTWLFIFHFFTTSLSDQNPLLFSVTGPHHSTSFLMISSHSRQAAVLGCVRDKLERDREW